MFNLIGCQKPYLQSNNNGQGSFDENGETSITRTKTFNFQRFEGFGDFKRFLAYKRIIK
jgi:hypothetical protein